MVPSMPTSSAPVGDQALAATLNSPTRGRVKLLHLAVADGR
jgi:hypothetical protein